MSGMRSPKLDFNVFNAPRRTAVGERPFEIGPPFGWDPTTANSSTASATPCWSTH